MGAAAGSWVLYVTSALGVVSFCFTIASVATWSTGYRSSTDTCCTPVVAACNATSQRVRDAVLGSGGSWPVAVGTLGLQAVFFIVMGVAVADLGTTKSVSLAKTINFILAALAGLVLVLLAYAVGNSGASAERLWASSACDDAYPSTGRTFALIALATWTGSCVFGHGLVGYRGDTKPKIKVDGQRGMWYFIAITSAATLMFSIWYVSLGNGNDRTCCVRDGCTLPVTEDLDWELLSAVQQASASAFGWTSQTWDADGPIPSGWTVVWGDLSVSERSDATTLGWIGASDWDTCSVGRVPCAYNAQLIGEALNGVSTSPWVFGIVGLVLVCLASVVGVYIIYTVYDRRDDVDWLVSIMDLPSTIISATLFGLCVVFWAYVIGGGGGPSIYGLWKSAECVGTIASPYWAAFVIVSSLVLSVGLGHATFDATTHKRED